MYKKYWLFIMAALLLPTLGVADDAQAPQTTLSNLKISGYLDGSYNYLVNSNQFISGVNDRVYDLDPNSATLQQAAITIADQPTQGFGGLLNLMAGRDALTSASYGDNPNTGIHDFGFDPVQVFLQYAIGKFTIIAGKFNTIVGEEALDPTINTNFSRSIIYGYAEPGTFTGVRGTYAVNDKLNFTLGVDNGWDNIRDTSRVKTLEWGVSYIINPMFSFSTQGYTGEERATEDVSSGPTGWRSLIDVIGTMNATQKLTFVANYEYAWQTNALLPSGVDASATWTGIAGYINYKFNDHWRTSLRAEDFDDEQGFRTGVRQNWQEVTLTVGYAPIKDFELRVETRHDFSNVDSFLASDGIAVRNNQQSYALEGVYKF